MRQLPASTRAHSGVRTGLLAVSKNTPPGMSVGAKASAIDVFRSVTYNTLPIILNSTAACRETDESMTVRSVAPAAAANASHRTMHTARRGADPKKLRVSFFIAVRISVSDPGENTHGPPVPQ